MNPSFRRVGWGVTTAILLALAPGAARAAVVDVHVTSNQFTPDFVVVHLGDTVRWIFDEGVHSTTSIDGEWDSGLVPAGTIFEYTFDGTGQYDYYCTIHVDCCNMVGSVYVEQRQTKPKPMLVTPPQAIGIGH